MDSTDDTIDFMCRVPFGCNFCALVGVESEKFTSLEAYLDHLVSGTCSGMKEEENEVSFL